MAASVAREPPGEALLVPADRPETNAVTVRTAALADWLLAMVSASQQLNECGREQPAAQRPGVALGRERCAQAQREVTGGRGAQRQRGRLIARPPGTNSRHASRPGASTPIAPIPSRTAALAPATPQARARRSKASVLRRSLVRHCSPPRSQRPHTIRAQFGRLWLGAPANPGTYWKDGGRAVISGLRRRLVPKGPRSPQREDRMAKPTIVLVHGASADGSSSNGVSTELQAPGLHRPDPTEPPSGVTADAPYVASFLARAGTAPSSSSATRTAASSLRTPRSRAAT